jgi:hypothetical protein
MLTPPKPTSTERDIEYERFILASGMDYIFAPAATPEVGEPDLNAIPK